MAHALFLFDDRRSGQQAAMRLVEQGLPPDAVVLHVDETQPQEHIGSEFDEIMTGGFVSNLADLLRGVFEWGSPQAEVEAYADALREGASVVRVEAKAGLDRAKVDSFMKTAGCRQRTDWTEMATS